MWEGRRCCRPLIFISMPGRLTQPTPRTSPSDILWKDRRGRWTGGSMVFDNEKAATVTASEWKRFYELFSPPGGYHWATIFLGELQKPDGTPRLVAIEASNGASDRTHVEMLMTFDITVISPGSLWH